jgi:rhodanese-related sulfurtransferase
MKTEIDRSEKNTGLSSAFEICRRAADTYMNSGKPLYITAKDVCNSIVDSTFMARQQVESYDPTLRTEGPFMIDLRDPDSEMPELYYCGHIPGAINIPWRTITSLKMLSSLPRDRQILVYSNSGQIGGQVAAILSIMGYNAVNLKWGITSWTKDNSAAPERFDITRDVLWQNKEYRSTTSINLETEGDYPLPDIQVKGRSHSAVIWTAADNYLRGFKQANISASALFDPMFENIHPLSVSPYEQEDKGLLVLPFAALPGDNDAFYSWPFILDIRHTADYQSGHIPGSINIEAKELFQAENLRKIPSNRRIAVCSKTGHTSAHVTALLNILGYDAVNLKWGMSGWSLTEDKKVYYSSDRDCMDYPIVKGWIPGRPTKCKS